jgi:peptidyl-prolyl cis-trans isomerase C
MKLKLILSAALVAGVISAQAASVNAAAPATNSSADAIKSLFGDPVVVKAKGFEIKRSEVDELFASMKSRAAANGEVLPPEFQMAIVNQLVTIQLLLQKSTSADRALGQQNADTQFTNIVKKFPSPEAFQRQLKAANTTEAELRGKAAQEAIAMATLKRELNITISDADAKDYYDKHAANFEEPEKTHVRHILLMTIDPSSRPPASLSTNTVAAKRKQIDDLLKRAKAGEDFAKLATQFSEDPGSKENGGELPEFPRGQMVPEFEAAAFSLAKDQVSDVITTAYGFHIIKSLGKTAAKKVAYAESATEIKDGLAGLKIKEAAPDFVKKLRAEFNVEILDPALKALDEKVQAQAAEAAASEAAPALTPAK